MKNLFWNVDTQYDFMRSNGRLYVDGAEKIEGNLRDLTTFAEKRGIKVINTADWHNNNSKEFSSIPDFINTFPKHCMKNDLGSEYIPATKPKNPYIISWEDKNFDMGEVLRRRNLILYKDKFDIFSGNFHTNKILELLNPQKIVVYGVATNVCVNFAVNGLLERNFEVYIPIDAIKELQSSVLPYKKWEKKGGIVTSTSKIFDLF